MYPGEPLKLQVAKINLPKGYKLTEWMLQMNFEATLTLERVAREEARTHFEDSVQCDELCVHEAIGEYSGRVAAR